MSDIVTDQDMTSWVSRALDSSVRVHDLEGIVEQIIAAHGRTLYLDDDLFWSIAAAHEITPVPPAQAFREELTAKMAAAPKAPVAWSNGRIRVTITRHRPGFGHPTGLIAAYSEHQAAGTPPVDSIGKVVPWEQLWDLVQDEVAALEQQTLAVSRDLTRSVRAAAAADAQARNAAAERDDVVGAALSPGLPVDKVMTITGLSRARIYQICNRTRAGRPTIGSHPGR